MKTLQHNLWQFLIALDQLYAVIFCTLLNEKAYADVTLSALSHHWKLKGRKKWVSKMIDTVFWWDYDHCHVSYLKEREKGHTPKEWV